MGSQCLRSHDYPASYLCLMVLKMYVALFIVIFYAWKAQALPANLTNSTIPGNTSHGNEVTCPPTTWYNIVIFFVGNYLAHAATVKSYPGERTWSLTIATVSALLIPTTGLIRGINSIARNAKLKRKRFWAAALSDPDYQTAAAAGALCMVVRKKSWKPYPGDKLSHVMLRDEVKERQYSKSVERKRAFKKRLKMPMFFEVEQVPRRDTDGDIQEISRTVKVYRSPWAEEWGRHWMYTDTYEEYVHPGRAIHGFCDFKDQEWSYALAHVPRDAVIAVRDYTSDANSRCLESTASGSSQCTELTASIPHSESPYGRPNQQTSNSPVIGASYSIPKAVFAIAQLSYATVTLYRTHNDQIDTFGYCAFGLTVIPYALMSLVNLMGNIMTPEYHALYLVASDVMDEATRRGARFDGVVGRLVPETDIASATAEVLLSDAHKGTDEGSSTGNEEKHRLTISYCDGDGCTRFPASTVDYSSPSGPISRRRKYVREKIESTSKDLSPSIFVPSCSKFRRLRHYDYTIDVNRTQMTYQGAFSFTAIALSTGYRSTACLASAAIVMAIIGAVTKFNAESATNTQENMIMNWYILGALYGGFSLEDMMRVKAWSEPDWGKMRRDSWVMILPCFLHAAPAIGGFVVVVEMLLQYGNCTPV